MSEPLVINTLPRTRISSTEYQFGDVRIQRFTADGHYHWRVTSITAFEGGTNLANTPVITFTSLAASYQDGGVDVQPTFTIEQNESGNVTSIEVAGGGQINARRSSGNSNNYPPTISTDGNTVLDPDGTVFFLTIANNDEFNPPPEDSYSEPIILATVAAADSLAACGKSPADAINSSLADLKSSISGAVDASGLNNLMAQLGKYKDDLMANLPNAPQPLDFATEFADLLDNITDIGVLNQFKERWGDVVPDLDSLLEGAAKPDFSICDIKDKNIKATVGADGKLEEKKVAPEATIPQENPEVVPKTSDEVETKLAAEEPIGAYEKQFNVTAAQGIEGLKAWNSAVLKLWSIIVTTETDQASSELIDLKAKRAYQIFLRLRANGFKQKNKFVTPKMRENFRAKEQEIYGTLYKSKSEKKILQKYLRLITWYVSQGVEAYLNNDIGPYPNEKIVLKGLVTDRNLGVKLYGSEAIYDSSLYEHDVLVEENIRREFANILWNNDLIKGYCRYLLSRQEDIQV